MPAQQACLTWSMNGVTCAGGRWSCNEGARPALQRACLECMGWVLRHMEELHPSCHGQPAAGVPYCQLIAERFQPVRHCFKVWGVPSYLI